MPSGKVTSGGCPLFTGKVFKDYLDGEFRMFLRRLGIARVLDPSKNPRELYELPPAVAPLEEQAPATAVQPTPRTTRRGSAPSPSSTSSPVSDKDRLAHQRLVQSVRAERLVRRGRGGRCTAASHARRQCMRSCARGVGLKSLPRLSVDNNHAPRTYGITRAGTVPALLFHPGGRSSKGKKK